MGKTWYPANTLEGRQQRDLEHIYISAKMIVDGQEPSRLARLLWMQKLLENVVDAQERIEKRDERKARQELRQRAQASSGAQ